MDKTSELDCYLYFMWNVWSKNICIQIFGQTMGEHYWSKWVRFCDAHGPYGAPTAFYVALDDARIKLRTFAVNHYNGIKL